MLSRSYKAPTVKQHLAAIRMLFDWLIVGQVVGQNPAAVRGPKHVVKKGKTPVRDGDEARQLLASIDISTVGGLRDRALIALLIYSFARISAAMMVEGPTAAVRAFNPLSGMLRWCIGKGSGGIQRP